MRCSLLIAIGLTVGLCHPAWACVKSMRWSDDPPFTYRRGDGEISGFEIDIAREALRRLGCKLEPAEMPFGRGLREIELGRLDMAGSAFRRPERELYAHYAQTVINSRNRLYVRRDTLPNFKAHSLREWFEQGHRLGVQPGVNYGSELTALAGEARYQPQLQQAAKRAGLWRMLERRRIDGLIVDEGSAANEIKRLGLEPVVAEAPFVISSEPSHTIFSKRSTGADFVERYSAVLSEMSRDGSLKDILGRYGLRP